MKLVSSYGCGCVSARIRVLTVVLGACTTFMGSYTAYGAMVLDRASSQEVQKRPYAFVEHVVQSSEVANARVTKDAEAFIDKLAQEAIGFLSDPAVSETHKKKAFRSLLHDRFDLNTIGRFALGRYWRTASAEQRREYQSLFENMVVDVYSSRFGEYSDQTFQVTGGRQDNEKDVTVHSVVSDDGQKIRVDWRVRYKNGQYRVIDVVVEGVSMALTQRSDFSAVIQRGGGKVDVLLAHLKQN